ncbi:MAG: hypothetical protein AB7L66_20725 [Gemmatimonadales bacterium]
METIEAVRAPDPDEPTGHYFVVDSAADRWVVSVVMARHLEELLDQNPTPEWAVFVDLFGSRIRVRCAVIQSVQQYTADQRAAYREFTRKLERERRTNEWD